MSRRQFPIVSFQKLFLPPPPPLLTSEPWHEMEEKAINPLTDLTTLLLRPSLWSSNQNILLQLLFLFEMSVCATGWAGGGWQTIIPWPALGIKILRSVSRSELSSSPELDQDHGCNLKPKTCGQNETVQPQGHGKLSTRLEEMELDLTNISNSASLGCSSQMQWLVWKPILALKDFSTEKSLEFSVEHCLSCVCHQAD